MKTQTKIVLSSQFEPVPLANVGRAILIGGVSFEEYCNDVERVIREATADGLRGAPYVHYKMTKGKFNGKTETRYKPLNNLDLYEYAKRKYQLPMGEQ